MNINQQSITKDKIVTKRTTEIKKRGKKKKKKLERLMNKRNGEKISCKKLFFQQENRKKS